MTPDMIPLNWGMLFSPEFQRQLRGQGYGTQNPAAALMEQDYAAPQKPKRVDLMANDAAAFSDPSSPYSSIGRYPPRVDWSTLSAGPQPPVADGVPADAQAMQTPVINAPGVGITNRDNTIPLSALAAGLGMLANNTGHYGAAGPAIGKGGLIGLQTYGQERDRQSQQSQLASQNRIRDEQLKIQREQSGYMGRKLARQDAIDEQRSALQKQLFNAKTPQEKQAIVEQMVALSGDPDALLKQFAPQKPEKPDTKPGAVLDDKGRPMIDPRSGQPVIQEYAFNPQTNAYDIPAGGKRLATGGMNIQFGSPTPGVDPNTGQPSLYQVNPQGQTRKLDIQPMPSAGAKVPAEIQRQMNAMSAVMSGLDAFESVMKDIDPRSLDQLSPEKRARVEGIVGDLTVSLKEAAALGALTGPDLPLLEKILTNPLSVKGAFYGKSGIAEQIAQARASVTRRMQTMPGGQRQTFGGGLMKGQIVDGYRWNGGPPENQNSWEKVK